MGKQQQGGGSKAVRLVGAVNDASRPRPGEVPGCAASIDRFGEALEQLKAMPVALTLDEACRIIGEGVEPQRFAWTAFEALALEIEAVAAIDGGGTTIEVSRPLLGIAERARLASKIARQLSE